MRFGLKTAPQHTTFADMLAVWQAADEIELFESAWTFDHFYPIFTDDVTGPCLEGWVTTTALAQATERLRVGVLVTGLPYRHPAVLANMAATLDIVSNGRLELGLGAGWNEVEAAAYGIDIHATLTERFDAFDEGVEAIIALLTQERTTYDGHYVKLTDAHCNPKPVQRPHPPICIGGGGERRTLRAVARYAQHWNYPGGPVDQFAAKLEVLRRHCEEYGRDPAEITVSTHLRGEPEELVAQATAYRDAGLDLGIVYLQPPHTPDVLAGIAEALEPLRG
jgi:F420-dependent oxidoreductase-like protein